MAEAIRPEAWVVDGNYGPVRDGIWKRATHLVWLDYGRPLIMARVIRRSLKRAALRTEPWAGNRERWSQLVRSGHPVRWAREAEERLARPEYARVTVLRLRHPREARKAIERLAGELLMRTPST